MEIIFEAKVQCNSNYYNFEQFNYYNLDRLYDCGDNDFSLIVDGYSYSNNGKGNILQAKLKEDELRK